MVDIGTLIKEERKKQGITIAELAKKAQVTRRAIYYWESGERGITVDCADRILKVLNISVLLGETKESEQAE